MSTRRVLMGAVLVCAAGLAGCGNRERAPQVGFVEVAPAFGSDALNAQVRTGLSECNRQSAARTATAVTNDPERQMILFATENVDSILVVGPALAETVGEVARRFEARHFILIGGVALAPNVESIVFDDRRAAFAAGALAAAASRNGIVAFSSIPRGMAPARAVAGFAAGIAALGRRPAVRFVQSGQPSTQPDVNAVYSENGPRSFVVEIAAPQPDGSRHILANIVRRYDAAALRACLETVAQKPASGVTELDLANGGFALAVQRSGYSQLDRRTAARFARIERRLASGALKPRD